MNFINSEVKITKNQAHEMLMKNINHYLWHKEYYKWTTEDFENLLKGKNKFCGLRQNPKYKPVEVVFKDGTKGIFDSLGHLANEIGITHSALSNILAGRRTTKHFLSIQKI